MVLESVNCRDILPHHFTDQRYAVISSTALIRCPRCRGPLQSFQSPLMVGSGRTVMAMHDHHARYCRACPTIVAQADVVPHAEQLRGFMVGGVVYPFDTVQTLIA